MELEGLKRGLQWLGNFGLHIEALVTDRHLQIQKFLRETHPNITHYFDVWHVAKGTLKKVSLIKYSYNCVFNLVLNHSVSAGLKKKLQSLSKKKGFELVAQWQRSIINHLYWSVSSSAGNGVLVKAKWLSICNHLQNNHQNHDNPVYPQCTHPPLERKWFKPGGKLLFC